MKNQKENFLNIQQTYKIEYDESASMENSKRRRATKLRKSGQFKSNRIHIEYQKKKFFSKYDKMTIRNE